MRPPLLSAAAATGGACFVTSTAALIASSPLSCSLYSLNRKTFISSPNLLSASAPGKRSFDFPAEINPTLNT
jgi:hypothetical protein